MATPYQHTVGSPLHSGSKPVFSGGHTKRFYPEYDIALMAAKRITANNAFPIWIYKSLHHQQIGYFISGHGSHTLEAPDSPLSSRQIDHLQYEEGLPTLLEGDPLKPSAVSRLAYRNGEYLQCHTRLMEADIIHWCMMQSDPALVISVSPKEGEVARKKITNKVKSLLQNALFCQVAIRWVNRLNFAVAVRWQDDNGPSPKQKVENGQWVLSVQEMHAQGVKSNCEDYQKLANDR